MADEELHSVADGGDGNPSEKGSTEQPGARSSGDDWDKLVESYRSQNSPGPEWQQRIEAIEQREQRHQVEKELGPVLEKVRGEIPSDLYDDDDLRDYIDREYQKDPEVKAAWDKRRTDPEALDKALAKMSGKLAKRFGGVDRGATEDRDAVAAAVRGSSGSAPRNEPPDYAAKSDQDYAEDVHKKYGYRPKV